jgi:hypothetical protein
VSDTLDPRLAGATFVDLPESLRQSGINGVLVSEVKRGSRAASNGWPPATSSPTPAAVNSPTWPRGAPTSSSAATAGAARAARQCQQQGQPMR